MNDLDFYLKIIENQPDFFEVMKVGKLRASQSDSNRITYSEETASQIIVDFKLSDGKV